MTDNHIVEQVRETLQPDEARAIITVRQVDFGKVIIYKENGKIVRQEKTEVIRD